MRRSFVGNYYDPRLDVPGDRDLVLALNAVIGAVVAAFPSSAVKVVDIFSAFDGRSGLLLIEKKGASANQIHPTDAGYRAIANAFILAIKAK